jgi:hypothetical protein
MSDGEQNEAGSDAGESRDVDRMDGPDEPSGLDGTDVAAPAPAGSRRALADIDPS